MASISKGLALSSLDFILKEHLRSWKTLRFESWFSKFLFYVFSQSVFSCFSRYQGTFATVFEKIPVSGNFLIRERSKIIKLALFTVKLRKPVNT